MDHKCRVTLCVNPAHLRLATNKQNMENVGPNSRNTSGVRGVTWYKPMNKWKAQLGHHGKVIYLGCFDTIEEAGAVATAKRVELYTHYTDDLTP